MIFDWIFTICKRDWGQMYSFCSRHSILGVSFPYLQECCPLDEDMLQYGISEQTYEDWMAAAASIQERNAALNECCGTLNANLRSKGIDNCVIKGQSLARYYGELACLRQPGDIDVWTNASISDLVAYAETIGKEYKATFAHVEVTMFDDVKVELHPTPAFFRCPWLNNRLQRWISTFDIKAFDSSEGFRVAPTEFNLVYLPVHIYNHVLNEGIGLRQYMDYYFVLKSVDASSYAEEFRKTISSFHMTKFMRGVMWVMKEVFGLEDNHLPMEPDEKVGRLLMDEALEGGNFGQYDKRDAAVKSPNAIVRVWGGIVRSMRFFSLAPEIVICSPFWRLWHFFWMKSKGYR